jgi:hypothetical protein
MPVSDGGKVTTKALTEAEAVVLHAGGKIVAAGTLIFGRWRT